MQVAAATPTLVQYNLGGKTNTAETPQQWWILEPTVGDFSHDRMQIVSAHAGRDQRTNDGTRRSTSDLVECVPTLLENRDRPH
jgi:hypothetical protein